MAALATAIWSTATIAMQSRSKTISRTNLGPLRGFFSGDQVYEGGSPTAAAASHRITLNSLDAAVLGLLTTLENDATLAASNGIVLGMGNTISGNGQVDGKVTADPGSVIEADGSLVLGDVSSIDGYSSNGELRTNEFTLTLRDLDTAVLGPIRRLVAAVDLEC